MSPLTEPFNITFATSTVPSMEPVSLTDRLEPSVGTARTFPAIDAVQVQAPGELQVALHAGSLADQRIDARLL